MRYLRCVQTLADKLAEAAASPLNTVTVPDLWQQEAVTALREGKDVVVHAPTGAGKTLIFELWSNGGKNRNQAIYTVPTRALANDKLAEWRARGWDVGIATGDLSENLNAPVIVATLETQKNRLIQGDGPALLVVDEYQMIGDPDRGLNYELAIALAPPKTQLLLLSGSVGNPQDVVKWLRRIGRNAVQVKYEKRPVPLDEVFANNLNYHVPSEVKGYWPRFVAKALAEDLGPVLVFAPRRQATETLAADLARYLPNPNPLELTPEQKLLVGENLAKMLKSRVAYHHSGLSYGARAGVIEPLAKAGQLRCVVATMGLAAGINFSLRSVTLAGESYRRDQVEQPLRPDEILQMFGRAGRRGIDEVGYVLVSSNQIRLNEGYAAHLSRSGMVDWGALLGIMAAAADQGREPFIDAVRVQERLFTTKPIFLGVEESLKHPVTPCGLKTDAERARHVGQRYREMRNSRGEWQAIPKPEIRRVSEIQIAEIKVQEGQAVPQLRPMLTEPAALDKVGTGQLCELRTQDGRKIHGRAVTVAETMMGGRVFLAKWVRRMTGWNGREMPMPTWQEKVKNIVATKMAEQGTPVIRFEPVENHIVAQVSLENLTLAVPVDQYGVALWNPVMRDILPPDCAVCDQVEQCRRIPAATGTALLWRRLGLVEASGKPTLRGRIVSFFQQGYGLAIAAALEDKNYSLNELIYDIANLDAGFRFCTEESRWGGRLPMICHEKYGNQNIPGYLENGLPPKYGSGAETVVAGVHKNPASKAAWITDFLGVGDIDRVIIEWRSLLRQIAHSPKLDWPRYAELQKMAKEILNETESPTLTELPPLEYHQTKRVEHKLHFRR
ncbi:MAG TPA: DEAD/DEAH box helicase [Verrucomicrobiae bacterium]